jgi:adenylate kinase family enzyme
MRLSVVGTSCAGKTTLARAVAGKLGIKFIEQDRLFWRPGWEKAPKEEFRSAVLAEIEAEDWTICGNYSAVRNEVWKRATHIVWLNYGLPVVLWWWLKRTVPRIVTGEECCNGNRETFRSQFLSTESLIWWIFKTHWRNRAEYSKVKADRAHGSAKFLEFKGPREAAKWLSRLTR